MALERATASRPTKESEMLEAVWLNRVRKSEGVEVAGKTANMGYLSEGRTYVTSNVELREGGELDTVLFRVEENGDVTALKAWEAGVGKLENKPDRQLRTNLLSAERGGSSSHESLDAEAFSHRSTEAKHRGYVGFSGEYDHNLAADAVPTGGEPVYTKAEFDEMNRDLGLATENPEIQRISPQWQTTAARGT